jgi:CubicO group peptidase (beta-lactamase class C family)
VKEFTSPATPANQPILFGLGFDIDSPLSAAWGDLFSVGGFSHTGFTGTSLYIDPATSRSRASAWNAGHSAPAMPSGHGDCRRIGVAA